MIVRPCIGASLGVEELVVEVPLPPAAGGQQLVVLLHLPRGGAEAADASFVQRQATSCCSLSSCWIDREDFCSCDCEGTSKHTRSVLQPQTLL